MATSLIDSLSGDFEPEQYHDDYRVALEELIEAKVAGRDVVTAAEEPDTGGAVVDLMAALRASVEAARKNREAAGGAPPAGGVDAADVVERADGTAEAPAPRKRAPRRPKPAGDEGSADTPTPRSTRARAKKAPPAEPAADGAAEGAGEGKPARRRAAKKSA